MTTTSMRRPRRPNGGRQTGGWFCQCGKRAYNNRKEAKATARQLHPSEKLTAYECDRSAALRPAWHIGHMRGDERG